MRFVPGALRVTPLLFMVLTGCDRGPDLVCGDPYVSAADIQGRDRHSPLNGQFLQTEAVATGWLLDENDGLYGSFVESAAPDNDPSTAEGLLVKNLKLEGGTRYRIAATVHEEESGLTTLVPGKHVECGAAELPPPQQVSLPIRGRHIESLEGMRIELIGPLTLSGVERMGSRGEAVVSSGTRLYQPTEVAQPGERARQVAASNTRRSLIVDDFSLARDRGHVAWWPDWREGLPQAGADLDGLQGILDHRFGYRLHLSAAIDARPAPAIVPPAGPGDQMRVVSFNLLNLFNGNGRGGGFPTDRGAESQADYRRQLDKLVAAMTATRAALFALSELENDGDGPDSALGQLAAELSKVSGRDYRSVAIPEAGLGGDQIVVGMIYDADLLAPQGPSLTRSGYPWNDFNRPPLVQKFLHKGSGESFTAISVHFKSKGCNRADETNRDQGDGQGCFNAKRVEAARDLVQWLGEEPSLDPARTLVIGDFNAYSQEQPLKVFRNGGFRPLVESGVDGYTYVYQGRAGALDHAVAGAALARLLAVAQVWHINASQPDWLDYRSAGKPGPQLYQPDPRRSSDHDPVVLDFRMR